MKDNKLHRPMKTRISQVWLVGLVLAVAAVPRAVAQDGSAAKDSAAPETTVPSDLAPPTLPLVLDKSGSKENCPSNICRSSWLTEIIKLAQAGIADDVLLPFIDSAGTFNLGADQIIYLRDLGVSSEVISAIIQHDWELASGFRQVTPSTVPMSQPALQLPFAVGSQAPVEAATPSSASSSIVNVMPSDPSEFELTTSGDLSAAGEQEQASAEKQPLYRVREPYPVKLLDPIIFINAQWPPPNMVVITLPH